MQRPLKPDYDAHLLFSAAKGATAWGGLFSTLLAFNGLQMSSLALIPFSRKAFWKVNRWSANTWWGWCVRVVKALHGTDIVLTGDEVPTAENALLAVNHQQMTDITALMEFARQKDRLGDLKFFVKDAVKYVPGIGWGMLFLNMVFLKREWLKDKESIKETFRALVERNVPCWLVIFVEGTRITPEKLERSRAYAERKDLPVTEHVLLPRPKGFAAAVDALRGHVTAVYDVTIGYNDGIPSLSHYIIGAVDKIHIHVKRFPIDEMPTGEAALAEWLRARFMEKDALLDEFLEQGRFPQEA